jgi:rhodanese-related sulfurtransferase
MTDKIPERISIPDLKKKLETSKKLVIVDVREPKEIKESGAIPGAVQIPIKQLEQRMDEFPKTADLVFYCGGGGRGSRAAAAFLNAGYPNAQFCGLRDWKKQGLPTA